MPYLEAKPSSYGANQPDREPEHLRSAEARALQATINPQDDFLLDADEAVG